MKLWPFLPPVCLLLANCASAPSAEETAARVADARKSASALTQALGGELKAAIAARGVDGAVGVCKERAPQIAAEVSAQGHGTVRRVSLKNRSPLGVPDAWESTAIATLEAATAAGRTPPLETWGYVSTPAGPQFRYAMALPVQPLCLACHGEPASLAPAVMARLAADYPQDKATGYSLGMMRGIVSVQRAL